MSSPSTVDYSSSRSYAATGAGGGGKRDISQFVKYLLEGSGVDEQSVDFAAIRRELESTVGSSPEREPPQDKSTKIEYDSEESYSVKQKHVSEPNLADKRKSQPKQPSNLTADEFNKSVQDIIRESHVEINLPTWDSVHLPAPSSFPAISIQLLSSTLEAAGFPPFPSHLFSANPASFSDQKQLLHAVYWALENVLQEYRLRVNLSNHLQTKLKQLGDQTKNLASHVDSLTRSHVREKHELLAALEEVEGKNVMLQNKFETSEDENKQLMKSLSKSNEDAIKWKTKYERLHDDFYREKERVADYVNKLGDAEEDKRRAQDRAEELVQLVTSQQTSSRKKSLVSRDIIDVVMFYEDKLEQARDVSASERVEPKEKPEKAHGETQTEEMKLEALRRSLSPQRNRVALIEEVRELRDQLESTVAAFEEVQNEKELLKLKLLSLQPGNLALNSDALGDKQMLTRDLIRRDKNHFKLKLYKIEDLSVDESKLILKSICERLDIKAIDDLVDALDDIAETIRLIPKMQEFIRAVDDAVWATNERVGQFYGEKLDKKRPLQKLSETVQRVKTWREMIDSDLVILKQFQECVARLLDENEDVPLTRNSLQSGPLAQYLIKIRNRLELAGEAVQ